MINSTTNVHPFPARPAADEYEPTTKDVLLFVAMMRHGIRKVVAALDQHHDTAHQHRRQARQLRERATPFDAARIAALEALAGDADAACSPLREHLDRIGKAISDAAPFIDARTTLAQRCEILNVNVADRGALTEADGLHHIIFAHGLEDSAARRKDDWKNGPLFRALYGVFIDFMINTEAGQKLGDSLFEPGGMFAGVPMYKQAADGTMVRQPPRLALINGGAPTNEGAPK